jgi:hypothetical protein
MKSMKEYPNSHTGPRERSLPPYVSISSSKRSLFEDVIFWSCRTTDADIAHMLKDPRSIAFPMYRLILADWLAVLKYMTGMLGLIEWSLKKPHWGRNPDDIDELLGRLSPWHRNMGYYKCMIADGMARLFPETAMELGGAFERSTSSASPSTMPSAPQIPALWPDFRKVAQQMADVQLRISSIQTMATNAITNQEARRAVKQNRNLARLTVLAAIFIPLNFTSSFLSMSPDFFNAIQTIWLFFALGVPITILALVTVDLTHPERKGYCRRGWKKLFGESKGRGAKDCKGTDVAEASWLRRTTTMFGK